MPWAEVLEGMEQRITWAERVMRHGGPPPPELRLPTDLGPLPADLVAQARAIEIATVRVAAQVSAARDLVAAALCRPPEVTQQPASYLDARV